MVVYYALQKPDSKRWRIMNGPYQSEEEIIIDIHTSGYRGIAKIFALDTETLVMQHVAEFVFTDTIVKKDIITNQGGNK